MSVTTVVVAIDIPMRLDDAVRPEAQVCHSSVSVIVAVAAGMSLLTPQPVRGQGRTPVGEVLPSLFGNTIVLTPTSVPDNPNHAAHFRPGVDQLQTPQQFNQQLVTLLATFPVGSSSGGFTYTFNPSLGTFSRSSESFGPLFAERALTIGRDRGSLGVGYQRSTYDTFEGKNLRQREIVFHVEHIDCCGTTSGGVTSGDGTRLNPAFEGDLIEAALALRLTTETVVFYGTYGLTDRLDIGVAVPLVSVDVDASIRARIQRLATAANPTIHQFDGDNPDERTFASAGSATGIGDIVVRAKYNFLRAGGGGLAAAVDLRTPTGDESNLLGTGGVQAKVYGIGSMAVGRLSPHVNVGYTASSKGALPGTSLKDEWNYSAGRGPRRLSTPHAHRGRARSIDSRSGTAAERLTRSSSSCRRDRAAAVVEAVAGAAAVAAEVAAAQ